MINCIDIPALLAQVEAEKSASSVRWYKTALLRLQSFAQSDKIPVSDFSSDYLSGFIDFLDRDNVKPSSKRQLLKCLRAILRPITGDEPFSDLDTASAVPTRQTDLDDFGTLLHADISSQPVLEKTRLLFLACVYAGGVEPASLASADSRTFEQISHRWQSVSTTTLTDYASRISTHEWAKALAALGRHLNLRNPLTPDSATAVYDAGGADSVDEVNRCRWFAMRTFGPGLDELTDYLKAVAPGASVFTVPMAIAREPRYRRVAVRRHAKATPVKASDRNSVAVHCDMPEDKLRVVRPGAIKPGRPNLLESLLFFSVTPRQAEAIRKQRPAGTHIYTLSDGVTPAPISSAEMHTFMILCRVAGDTLRLHFPTEVDAQSDSLTEAQTFVYNNIPTLTPGSRARITAGPFTGYVGIVSHTDTTCQVTLRLQTLSNATVTATVPLPLLTPLN